MIEILIALLAGLVGGVLSRWIPIKKKKAPHIPVEGPHAYEVRIDQVLHYSGSDLHYAKAVRQANPGSVLIADGVNRG